MNLNCSSVRRVWIVAVWLIALPLAGCVNLSAIREFGESSAATAEYTRLTEDYLAWPSLQKRYQPESQHAALDQVTRDRESQKTALLARHEVIAEYMDALGRLAADEVVNYDEKLDGLGRAAEAAGFATEEERAAAQQVAGLLLRASMDAWRQRKLKTFLAETDAPIGTLIEGLVKIVERGYLADIQAEKDSMDLYFRGVLGRSSDPAGVEAFKIWQKDRLKHLHERENAARVYMDTLQQIGKGHSILASNSVAGRLKSGDLQEQMRRYAKEIRRARAALETL